MDLDKEKDSRETKKMKMTDGSIANPNPNDEGRPNLIPNPPMESARLIGHTGFFWCEYGSMPTADQLFKLFSSMRKSPVRPFFDDISWIFVIELDEVALKNFEHICEENYAKDNNSKIGWKKNNAADNFQENDLEEDEFDLACCDLGISFGKCGPREGYDAFPIMMAKVFGFINYNRPPATIVFISGNGEFAPFLSQVKEKGYNVITISRSEYASSAFLEAGLIPYDWEAASRGDGLFPVGA